MNQIGKSEMSSATNFFGSVGEYNNLQSSLNKKSMLIVWRMCIKIFLEQHHIEIQLDRFYRKIHV